jgi:hypothetical protein
MSCIRDNILAMTIMYQGMYLKINEEILHPGEMNKCNNSNKISRSLDMLIKRFHKEKRRRFNRTNKK